MNEEPSSVGTQSHAPRKWSWQYPEDGGESSPETRPKELQGRSLRVPWLLTFTVVIISIPQPWITPVTSALLALMALFAFVEGVVTLVRTRWVFRSVGRFLEAALLFTFARLSFFTDVMWGTNVPWWLILPAFLLAFYWLMTAIERCFYPNETRLFDEASEGVEGWVRLRMRHVPHLN